MHRLALLEFGLFEALGFEGGRHAKSLYAEITSNPSVFAEFISSSTSHSPGPRSRRSVSNNVSLPVMLGGS